MVPIRFYLQPLFRFSFCTFVVESSVENANLFSFISTPSTLYAAGVWEGVADIHVRLQTVNRRPNSIISHQRNEFYPLKWSDRWSYNLQIKPSANWIAFEWTRAAADVFPWSNVHPAQSTVNDQSWHLSQHNGDWPLISQSKQSDCMGREWMDPN